MMKSCESSLKFTQQFEVQPPHKISQPWHPSTLGAGSFPAGTDRSCVWEDASMCCRMPGRNPWPPSPRRQQHLPRWDNHKHLQTLPGIPQRSKSPPVETLLCMFGIRSISSTLRSARLYKCLIYFHILFFNPSPGRIVLNTSSDRHVIIYIARLGRIWRRAVGPGLSSALCREYLPVLQLGELCSGSQAERLEEI